MNDVSKAASAARAVAEERRRNIQGAVQMSLLAVFYFIFAGYAVHSLVRSLARPFVYPSLLFVSADA